MTAAVAPLQPLSETLLREATEHSLRAFLEPNAVFLAERLHASHPSPSSANLLATAYLRHGLYSLAADVLRPPTTPENRYLYAVSQARINTPNALRDAEAHLRAAPPGPVDVDGPGPVSTTPGGACGLLLLASICHRTGRKDEAISLYRRAIAANPMLWPAFESLAAMGVVTNVDDVMPPLSDSVALQRLQAQPQFLPGVVNASYPSHSSTQATPPHAKLQLLARSSSMHAPLTPSADGAAASNVNAKVMQSSSHRTPISRAGIRPSSSTAAAAAANTLGVTPGWPSHQGRVGGGGRHSAADEAAYVTPSPVPSRLGARSYADPSSPVNPAANVIPSSPRMVGGAGAGSGGGGGGGVGGPPSMSSHLSNAPQHPSHPYRHAPPSTNAAASAHGYYPPSAQTPRRLPRRSISPGSLHTLRVGRRTRGIQFDDSSIRNPADLFTTPSAAPGTPSSSVGGAATSRSLGVSSAKQQQLQHMQMQRGSNALKSSHVSSSVHTPSPSHAAHAGLSGGPQTPSSPSTPGAGAQSGGNAAHDSNDIIDLMRGIGHIAAELGRFQCARVIELSNYLPVAQRNTGLILSLRGRAYLEKGDYPSAEHEFCKALQQEPSRADGIVEYYSTVLWQLKKEKHLAALAIRAHQVSPVSAAAWCAAGNCFSLQGDADSALRYFCRAIEASRTPNAYAHTLCGHEHLAKEDFDAALASYREALNIDERHYNALYGIGQVLLKQEQFGLAQSHLRSAVLINPRNSNLHYHLGVALASGATLVAAMEDTSRGQRHALMGALAELETAANLDVHNPVPRFERAKILSCMQRFQEARTQLEELRDLLPREAEVHFELSKVCQELGDKKGGLQALSVALDIEPKERKYKKALETLSNEMEADREVLGTVGE